MMKEYKEVINGKEYTLIDINGDESFILIKECKCKKCGELLRLTELLDEKIYCEHCE